MEKIAISITNQANGTVYYPITMDGVKLDQERSGTPSKLTFKVVKDGSLNFQEGDRVEMQYGEVPMFRGYVFSKKRDKQQQIEVTAYDQMRYLQNKYSYGFTNKKASEIIMQICNDYGLQMGSIEDTGYVIPSLIEEDSSLFDIILKALEETTLNTGNMFIFYDDFGRLQLKSLANMTTNLLIDQDTAENFDYTSSIDSDVYNKVVLYYVDEETNDRLAVEAKDEANISKWGLLQYFEKVEVPTEAQAKANALLSLYNHKTRELKISGAFGYPSVRGGSLVLVNLNVGDTIISNYLLVEKVTHSFEGNHYKMDLTINGNWGD